MPENSFLLFANHYILKLGLLAGLMSILMIACNEPTVSEQERIDRYIADYEPEMKQTESGIYYKIENPGTAEHPGIESTIRVHYRGKLLNGKEFDASDYTKQPVSYELKSLIKGWHECIPMLGKGGKGIFIIPSDLAYGEDGAGHIPANAPLIFEIELFDFYDHY